MLLRYYKYPWERSNRTYLADEINWLNFLKTMVMNNDTMHHNDEKLVQQFLTSHKHDPRPNRWFTTRVINKLPANSSSTCKIIMTVVTFVAVMIFGVLICLSTDYILLPRENNLSVSLLSIYTAMISTVILIALQVIRLIKTYF